MVLIVSVETIVSKHGYFSILVIECEYECWHHVPHSLFLRPIAFRQTAVSMIGQYVDDLSLITISYALTFVGEQNKQSDD